jgi:dipeptidyl-peptidase-4
MRYWYLLLILCFHALTAQKKKLSLEDIWLNQSFEIEKLESFQTMKTGDFYTVLNHNSYGTYLDKFDFATQEKIETLVLGRDLPGIRYFESYAFDQDEKQLLLGVNLETVYRRSKKGTYFVYDLATKQLQKISEEMIQEPTFSPDGKKIAYVYQNNIYVKDLTSSTVEQITRDGKINYIVNGLADWVYEEEFSLVRAFEWNDSSDRIAYLQFDESEVPEFSMDIYGSDLYPHPKVFKYPKAGQENSKIKLFIYDLATGTSLQPDLGSLQQHYVPRLKWVNETSSLVITTLNRHQNNLNLVSIDADNGKASLLHNEKDDAYVDLHDDLTFLKDNSFIWSSEKDGFNHLYHYDKDGKLKNQVTSGPWEVTKFYGYDPGSKRLFFQSTEEGSINRTIHSVALSGKSKKKLSTSVGTNDAEFSSTFKYFVNTHSNVETPTRFILVDAQTGKEIRVIKDNQTLGEKLKEFDLSAKEFSTLKTENGELNMYLIKPPDFDPQKTYPLLMFQYSGPGSQQVVNRWRNPQRHDYWHLMLAQEGFLIACVDGRGTGFKGRDFKKTTYLDLGKKEIEDQIEAARQLGELPYVDQSRIGIWGWSYGGYMSSLAITKGADVFKMAIAVAPVTSWRFYDTVYTERYLRTPEENPSGYDDNSPLNFADLLNGNYLLIHGTGDDNVHVQNSMRMIDALVDANKQFDYFSYPDRAHGIRKGRNTRFHLFQKMTTFIRNSLGSPEK